MESSLTEFDSHDLLSNWGFQAVNGQKNRATGGLTDEQYLTQGKRQAPGLHLWILQPMLFFLFLRSDSAERTWSFAREPSVLSNWIQYLFNNLGDWIHPGACRFSRFKSLVICGDSAGIKCRLCAVRHERLSKSSQQKR
jgi:hypothetical protein